MSKVLIIGLDGATWNLIKPWIDEGKLPTFKRLLDEGIHGELESTIPSYTIPAWNTLATGKNPGKLGIFTFMSRDDGGYEFKFSPFETESDIWKILSADGKKVIVVNVPNVHSTFNVNGWMVAGWLYWGKEALTYPKILRMELDEIVGGYEIDVMDVDMSKEATIESMERDREEYIDSVGRKKYIHRVYEVMSKRYKAFEFLLRKEWDFAFVVFVAPDRIQHSFWTDKKILLDCYKRLDIMLERILTLIDEETTLIIVSDHGFGPKKRIFNVNEWLLKERYLCLKSGNTSKLIKAEIILKKTKTLSLVKFLMKLLPPQISKRLKERAKPLRVDGRNIDWTRTKIFTAPFKYSPGDLYLNVKGREAKGVISPEEYEKTREKIIHKLKNLRDPTTGEKVPVTAYKREEVYEGDCLERAPDLVIQMNESVQAFNTTVGYDQIFMEGEGGEHRVNGIFLAYGRNMKRGMVITGAKIYDIAPTVLHIFKLAIPEDIDGRVLKEIFVPESEMARREIGYQASAIEGEKRLEHTWSEEEEEKVKERLRRLGYI